MTDKRELEFQAFILSPGTREQLNSTYATERGDDQSSAAVAFAIVAAALTYVVAVGAFLVGKQGSTGFENIPPSVQMLIPIVPLALTAYLALNLAGTIVRSIHIKRLERILEIDFKVSQANSQAFTFSTPTFRTDVADVFEFRWTRPLAALYAICSIATYVPIALSLIVFTVLIFIPGPWTWNKVLISALYAFAVAAVVVGLLLPSFVPERLRATRAQSKG